MGTRLNRANYSSLVVALEASSSYDIGNLLIFMHPSDATGDTNRSTNSVSTQRMTAQADIVAKQSGDVSSATRYLAPKTPDKGGCAFLEARIAPPLRPFETARTREQLYSAHRSARSVR